MFKLAPFSRHFLAGFVVLIIAGIGLFACSKSGVVITKGSMEEWEGVKGWAILGEGASTNMTEQLCGVDLQNILLHSNLLPDEQQKVYELICGENASPEGFKEFYNALPELVRLDLVRAFELYGYHINEYG